MQKRKDKMIFNPRQTVLVTCRGTAVHLGKEEELEDVFPLDWHSPCSAEPTRYAIFVSKKMPAAELIRSSQCFVVNFMDYKNRGEIISAGMLPGMFHDKFEKAGLEKTDCEKLVDVPRVRQAAGWIECRTAREIDSGDHILFIGDILYSEDVEPGAQRPFHTDSKTFTTTK